MKRIWIGILLLIFCFSAGMSVSRAEKAKGPVMVIKEKSFDFKEVDEGDSIEHTFKVLNSGDQPLEIRKVKPG